MKTKFTTLLIAFIVLTGIAQSQNITLKNIRIASYNMNNQTVADCSGSLYDSGGDTSNYGNNENKTFTINPDGAQQVKLIVSAWDIKEGDSILFYDGTSINSPLIASFSSYIWLTEIDANCGSLTIQLISDSTNTGAGFKMDWQAMGGTCTPDSTIAAPIANFNCASASGNKPLLADLTDNSENNPTGWTWLLPGADKTRIYEKNPTALYDHPGVYDVSLIVVNAGGRDTLTKKGFITVTEVPAQIYMFNGTVTKCNGTLYDDGGIEADYQNNIDYTLVIKPSGATSVAINFSEWEAEKHYDFLRIYNGTSTSAPLLGKWSNKSPGTVTANSGAMTLRFTSDRSVRKSGWKATWSSIGGDCGTFPPVADFSATTRTITTGSSVNFTDQSTNIPYTWNWSFEGGNPSTSNTQHPTVTYSTAGTFSVSLTSANAGGSGSTIKAGYITVLPDNNVTVNMKNGIETSCTGTLYDDGGGSGKYHNNKTYTLVIQPANATSITMNFTQWTVENNYDFLKIYNGASVNAPMLGSWSGTRPGTITTTGGAMTLKFTSDKYVNGNGWKATWVAKGGDCDLAIQNNTYRNSISNESENENDFVVYPNPATDEFTLSTNKLYKQVCIIDMTGRIILEIPINGNEMKIHLPEYLSGVYFIQLKDGVDVKTQKLVVR